MNPPILLYVGIGASAGGLEALEGFFRSVPVDSGCCFVVVQHLSPDFKSVLEELLARHTLLPIHRVEDGMAPAPNTIFLIPPKKLLTFRDGHFHLSARDMVTVAELPINIFFQSLAAEAGARAVGVVLSGGGSDGSAGVGAIHQAGGLVCVQEPATAEFDSMPRQALAATTADHVLKPEDMPAVILAYAHNPAGLGRRKSLELEAVPAAGGKSLDIILALLRNVSGIDFSHYKIGTVERRIERRMMLLKLPDLAAYASILAAQPEELDALYSDMLIGVTEFFRDAEAFDYLQEKVAPGLLAEARDGEVRIWIAGCATGEEVYSVAILFDEVARTTGYTGRFSIFATDVHRASLDFAAAGIYGNDRLKNINPERLARYFREEKAGLFRIIPEIRKRIVFAPHNLINDPPFTKIDLISCRNLLIYFDAELQERAIRLFYFALRDGGCLFIGHSEDIGRLGDVSFAMLDNRLKFFRKAGGISPPPKFRQQHNPRVAPPIRPVLPVPNLGVFNRQLLAAYDHILRQHVPAGLLVNEAFEILHYFGSVSHYLSPLEGRAHDNLLNRVEGDLRLSISTLLPRVFKTGQPVTLRCVRVKGPAGDERIDLVADLITGDRLTKPLVHLSFVNPRELPPPLPVESGTFVAGDELLRRINDLEIELQGTKENLQTAVEELQTSNEELQASNEELTTSNEELQSTNEELSAVNEELYTVNTEFERKNIELQLLNDDLNNLSNSTDTGTVFVNRDLRIRKFNTAIQRIFRLQPQDIGRPIDHIAYHLAGHEQMLQSIRWVLEHGQPHQKEVRTHDGRWLLKKVMPFLTLKGAIDGVVLTFTDIDETKALHERLDLAMHSSKLVWWEWNLLTDHLSIHCGDTCILDYTPDNIPQSADAWKKATHPDDLPKVLTSLQECLEGKANEWACEHRFRMANGAWRWVLNSGKVNERDAQGRPLHMLGTTQDIGVRRAAEDLVHRDAEILSKITEAIICTDLDGTVNYWNTGAESLFGWTASEMVGQKVFVRFPPGEPQAQAEERLRKVKLIGELQNERIEYCKDGSTFWASARVVRTNDAQGRPSGLISLIRDITARKQDEEKHRQLEHQLFETQKMETVGTLAGGIAHDFNNIVAAILGHTELALMKLPPGDPNRRYHEVVLKASQRARELVKRILIFSHSHEPERQPTQLDEIVAESAKLIRATLPATVELQVDLEKNCPCTMADANQLNQVLLNLAANSAHAMRKQGGKLTISLRKTILTESRVTDLGLLEAGAYLTLVVSDTGHGIKPETLKKIFDPFFTTKPVGEGTGLGLSIVRGIMEGHGGAVEVASTLDVGTTFTLYLPVVSPNSLAAASMDGAQKPLPKGEGERIAVIDDEQDIAQGTQHSLQALGYDTSAFFSAEAFFTDFCASLFTVDLVITDQTMPRLTGLQLAQKLRAAGHNLPIIIVSGYSQDLTPEALDGLGDIQTLKKPYNLGQLATMVHRMLKKSSSSNPF